MVEMSQQSIAIMGWIGAALFVGCFIAFGMFFLRARFAKQAIGQILAFFVPKAGKGYFKRIKLDENNMLKVPVKGKKGRFKTYSVADIATVPVDYPINWPRTVQTAMDMTSFDEESLEPLFNRAGVLTLSPMRFANMINQEFSSIGVRESREEAERLPEKRSGKTPMFIWWILAAVALAAVIALGYFILTKLDVIGAGMGVG